jgi:hypothetical protein
MSQSKLKKSYPLFHASEDRGNVVPVILKKLYSTHAYACIGEYRGDIKHQRCVPSVNQAQSAVMCAGNGTT